MLRNSMKHARLLGLLVMGVWAWAIGGSLSACQSAAPPASTAPGKAGAHKFGVDVNNAGEVGAVVAELEIAGYNRPADTSTVLDAGGTGQYSVTSELAVAVIGPGPQAIPISYCVFAPSAALTASNQNFGQFDVFKRQTDAGHALLASGSTTWSQVDSGADAAAMGNLTAWVPTVIPSAAGAYVTPGDIITVEVDKYAAGISIPQGKVSCFTNAN